MEVSDGSYCNVYLIISLEKSLLDLSKSDVVLEEIHFKYIVYQLLLTVHYLHSGDLVHGDIRVILKYCTY